MSRTHTFSSSLVADGQLSNQNPFSCVRGVGDRGGVLLPVGRLVRSTFTHIGEAMAKPFYSLSVYFDGGKKKRENSPEPLRADLVILFLVWALHLRPEHLKGCETLTFWRGRFRYFLSS